MSKVAFVKKKNGEIHYTTKDLPGSPLITDVFWRAWEYAYHLLENTPVYFIFNGMKVTIEREKKKPLFKVWIYSMANWSLYIRADTEDDARTYGQQFGHVASVEKVIPDIPEITKTI